MTKIGEVLRKYRKAKGWTLLEVRNRMDTMGLDGISVPYLSDVERGRTYPSITKIGELAGVYGVDSLEILGITKQENLPDFPGLKAFVESMPVIVASSFSYMMQLAEFDNKPRPTTLYEWYELYESIRRQGDRSKESGLHDR